MKNKIYNIWVVVLILTLTVGICLTGCKKDDSKDCPDVTKTELEVTITEAQQMHDAAVEGVAPGEYPTGAKADLQAAIDIAQQVHDQNCVIQEELYAANVSLEEAIQVFENKLITDVAPGSLVAHWLFNGDATDASGNQHHGTPSAGHENWGGGMPVLDTDRFGNSEYCYKFEDGGNIVVPQNPAFKPEQITVSVWMKLYESWAHNYFISYDIWHSWKIQVKNDNEFYFTSHIQLDDGSGGEAHINEESQNGSIGLNEWHHIVITYMSGSLMFYIDGNKVASLNGLPTGTLIDPHPGIDLCIGQALATADFDDDIHAWKEWLGYFKGWLDDMRIYNVVLTEDQVNSLYDYEYAATIE